MDEKEFPINIYSRYANKKNRMKFNENDFYLYIGINYNFQLDYQRLYE